MFSKCGVRTINQKQKLIRLFDVERSIFMMNRRKHFMHRVTS